jgi:hypothetical protein
MTYPAITSLSSESVVIQYDLDRIEVGPLFDSSISCAHFLSMLFFSMTYATGLPLLMPMAFVTLTISFCIDKLLLLRFYEKPPHMNDGVMQIILKILPFAAIIRLCFGCWMYGSKDLFDSKTSDAAYLDLYSNFLSTSKREYLRWVSERPTQLGTESLKNTLFILDRVLMPNVFPLLLLLALIIIISTIQIFWRVLPFFFIQKTIQYTIRLFQRLIRLRNRHRKVKPMIIKNDKQSIDEANDNINRNNPHNNESDNTNHDNFDNNGDMNNDPNESKKFVSDLRTNMNNQDKLNSIHGVNTNINNGNVHFDSNDDNELAAKPKPSRKFSLTNAISHSVSQIMNFSYQPLHNSAPFTGEYFCYIPNTKQSQKQCENCFSCKDQESQSSKKIAKKLKQLQNGWHIIKKFEDDDRIKNANRNKKRMVKYKIKIWTRDSHSGEQRRVIGDHKKTYEVIQDNGCNSYSLEKIPAYALVIQGIKEGSNLVINRDKMRQ